MTTDFTKPLQTVGGIRVRLVTTNGRYPYPVIGYVGRGNRPLSWTLEGREFEGHSGIYDLINTTEAA